MPKKIDHVHSKFSISRKKMLSGFFYEIKFFRKIWKFLETPHKPHLKTLLLLV